MRRLGLRLLLSLAAIAALATGVPAPLGGGSALAQDSGHTKLADDKSKEDKPRKKTAEEKRIERELKAVAKEFEAQDAKKLVARIAPKGRVSLRLGSSEVDRLLRAPAKGKLEGWFADRSNLKLKLKQQKGLVGTFELKFKKRGKDGEQTRVLTIELRKHLVDAKERLVLAAILIQG